MKITWTNNTAKVGGMEFVVFQAFDRSNVVVRINGLYDNYAPSSFDTEAEARAAAEEIASEIFGGEEVWRSETDGKVTYHKSAHVPAFRTKVQRGVWLPLEGQ